MLHTFATTTPMAQKLDTVVSATHWCIVLTEYKHISTNSVDNWKKISQ